MIPNYDQLRQMTDAEIVERYNGAARNTQVGTGFWLQEMSRRQTDRQTRAMLLLTIAIAAFTVVSTICTIIIARST